MASRYFGQQQSKRGGGRPTPPPWIRPCYDSNVPLSDREKQVIATMPTHKCTYSENLVKIGSVHSEINDLQGGPKGTVKNKI